MTDQEFLKLYDLESYLLDTVRPRFHQQGYLCAFDFFCIIIWKANRAKTKIGQRLAKLGSDLDQVVRKMTGDLHSQPTDKGRLHCLCEIWGFRLPMASAILSILYPEHFTVYDIRVCNILGDYHNIAEIQNFDRRWQKYCDFLAAVKALVPGETTLRNKDRVLWARSFAQQLHSDIASGFDRQKELPSK